MQLTEMSSTADRVTPTITYAGRLRDSRKGIELFFDALELVWAARPDALARVWVIGGSPAEVQFAIRSAMARPRLAERIRNDAVTFWGRIEHESLPEFYSRSTAVIVPSFREQFGMVAVEAMMCGSAVVAARVGGLQDVVVSGHTGMLFDSGNPAALAACIFSYVNAPELSAWHGTNARGWARDRFDAARVLPLMEAALQPSPLNGAVADDSSAEELFIERSSADLAKVAERLVGSVVRRRQNLTSSHSLSFRIDFEHGTVFAKQYSRRPSSIYTIHGDDAEPRLLDPALYKLNLMARLSELPYVPTVVARDDAAGLILQEWVDAAPPMTFDETRRVLGSLQQEIAETELLSRDALDAFVHATGRLPTDAGAVTGATLRGYDDLAANLHAPLHDGVLACRRMHPQVELFRIAEFLHRNRPLLPQQYIVRALAEIQRLLQLRLFAAARPVFAHGSLKAEHILGRPERYRLCDFDQTGYYVGPLDTVHWLWDYVERQNVAPDTTFVNALADADHDERYLAACWLLALILNKDLVFVMRGEWTRLDETMRWLWTFGDVVRALALLG
jgi:Glycosyl transferases group 1